VPVNSVAGAQIKPGQVKMFEDRCAQLVSVVTLWSEDRSDCTRVLLLIVFGESSLRRALHNIWNITTGNATIRARRIGFCFLRGQRQRGTWEQCGAENDGEAC